MKTKTSVIRLFMSDAFPKLCAVLGSAAVIEMLLIRIKAPDLLLFEAALDEAYIRPLWTIGMIILYLLLAFFGRPLKTGNTDLLLRLSLRQSQILLLQAAADGLCFLSYWAAQIAFLPVLLRIFSAAAGQKYSASALYLALLRCNFPASLLPLGRPLRFLFLLTVLIVLSLCCAAVSMNLRNGRKKALFGIIYAIHAALNFAINQYNIGEDPVRNVTMYAVSALPLLILVFVIIRAALQPPAKEPEEPNAAAEPKEAAPAAAEKEAPKHRSGRRILNLLLLLFTFYLASSFRNTLQAEIRWKESLADDRVFPALNAMLAFRFLPFTIYALWQIIFGLSDLLIFTQKGGGLDTLRRTPGGKRELLRCFREPAIMLLLAALLSAGLLLYFRHLYLSWVPADMLGPTDLRPLWRIFL